MASGKREIKRRLKSVKSTQKVTKAMEMVAASKMRKAVSRVLNTRDYANLAWATVLALAEKTDSNLHPLLQKTKKTEKVALIVVSSNRGLCGGFNIQAVQKAIKSIEKHKLQVNQTDVITLGSKGRDIVRGLGYEVVADFEKQDITLNVADVSAVAHLVIRDFVAKKYDKVFIAFTDFVSSLSQIPRVKQLLPLEKEDDEYLGVASKDSVIGTSRDFIEKKKDSYVRKGEYNLEYIFEPTADAVLEAMLPRLIETQVYQAVLETEASEHSARMVAMKNANESAAEMLDDLTLSFNRARQAGITQEIAEISSAADALR